MKTIFKKITAASLAALTLAFGFCATAFASEKEEEKDDYKYEGHLAYFEEREYYDEDTFRTDDWVITEDDYSADDSNWYYDSPQA